jgi:hypothetical protein
MIGEWWGLAPHLWSERLASRLVHDSLAKACGGMVALNARHMRGWNA